MSNIFCRVNRVRGRSITTRIAYETERGDVGSTGTHGAARDHTQGRPSLEALYQRGREAAVSGLQGLPTVVRKHGGRRLRGKPGAVELQPATDRSRWLIVTAARQSNG